MQASSDSGSPAGFDLIETMAFDPAADGTMIERHLARIAESATTLGFAFDRASVTQAIDRLCHDVAARSRLRLMVGRGGAFALELGPMPAALPDPVPCVILRLPVDPGDWRLRHRTSDRGFYRAGLAAARGAGAVEALFVRHDGLMTEGCFTNLFAERDDGMLLTPPATLGLQPSVLRAELIAAGRAIEHAVRPDDLIRGFWIGNALRGLMKGTLA